jgi:hypothetical protein
MIYWIEFSVFLSFVAIRVLVSEFGLIFCYLSCSFVCECAKVLAHLTFPSNFM